jgi:hypothetical protein
MVFIYGGEIMSNEWKPSYDASPEQAIREAIGTGSMCWEHPENAGVFLSDQALWVADGLIKYLREK